jgi:L,D-peptidoglycan transpeptidase YkuD (ErfK/YbiS/YcfS/YnhG family)
MRIGVYNPLVLIPLAAVILCPGYLWNGKAYSQSSLQESPPVRGSSLPDFADKEFGDSSQVLVVRNTAPDLSGSASVQIFALEKRNGRWEDIFAPMDGVIGRNGFAPPGEKREGDGRTPSGIFPLGTVFGYKPSFPTKMSYRQAGKDDLWVDDVNADDYNRWVTRETTKASSFEKMRRDDDLYKLGIVVEYNTNPVVKGQGSAIFFHLWSGKGMPTAGCIALSEDDLGRLVQWLDPMAKPLVVMGTDAAVGGYSR